MSTAADTELDQGAEALRIRLRYMPSRSLIGLVTFVFSGSVIGWLPASLWFAAWIVASAVEWAVSRPVVRGAPMTPMLFRAGAASLAVSGFVFSGLNVLYWWLDGAQSGGISVLLVCGALMNALLICQSSRRMFLALMTPSLFFLMLQPIMVLMFARDMMLLAPISACVVAVIGTATMLWRHIDGTHRAEQAARLELQASAEQAQAAVAAKNAFVAMVGHELRTPISGVLAAAGELERSGDLAIRDHGRMIADSGRLMRTVLNDLLDLAKIEAGRMSVEDTVFNLRETVEQACRFWQVEAEGKGLDLALRGAERLPRAVHGDPTRLRQILNNLLSNAVKFTDHGAVSVLIGIGEDAEGRPVVRLGVSDSGPGIAPDRLGQLFTPFTQGDVSTNRLHGGTGLGLAISRRLARLMGGELDVDSRPGAGSTFTLKLLLKVADEIVAPRALAPAAGPEGGLRLLVADDHQINRRALKLLLGPLQPSITEAANGAEALAALSAEPFDLILMDVHMPDLSGMQVTRALRGMDGPNRETPVLAVTASTEPEDMAACREAGMDGFVAKPIDARELLAAVSAYASVRVPSAEPRQAAA